MFLKLLVLFSLIIVSDLHPDFDHYDDFVYVKTSSGVVRGRSFKIRNNWISEFLNIPYAEPPVGKLRFAKPLPLNEPKNVLKS